MFSSKRHKHKGQPAQVSEPTVSSSTPDNDTSNNGHHEEEEPKEVWKDHLEWIKQQGTSDVKVAWIAQHVWEIQDGRGRTQVLELNFSRFKGGILGHFEIEFKKSFSLGMLRMLLKSDTESNFNKSIQLVDDDVTMIPDFGFYKMDGTQYTAEEEEDTKVVDADTFKIVPNHA